MIAKITRGSRAGDLAAYLHGPGNSNEHEHEGKCGGAVIGGNLGREGEREGKGWAADLREAAASRPEIKNPIWHMSLRAAPEDRRLTDAEWREAAAEMGEKMGWADKPYVVVRHGDDHVHIAVSRVGHDGKVWHGRNDRRAAQKARQGLEERYGLTQAPTTSSEQTRRVEDHQVKQGEYRHGQRTGKTPERVELASRVWAARDAAEGQGRAGFDRALTAAGVEYRAAVSKTGKVSGYSYHLPGHRDAEGKEVWWKASQLDRGLSWGKTAEVIDRKRPPVAVEVPRGRLESKAKHDQRVSAAQGEAQARVDERHMAAVPQVVAARSESNGRWWQQQHTRQQQAQQARAERRAVFERIGEARAASFTLNGPSPQGGAKTAREEAADRIARVREEQARRSRERGGFER